jgi:hypothetical protein
MANKKSSKKKTTTKRRIAARPLRMTGGSVRKAQPQHNGSSATTLPAFELAQRVAGVYAGLPARLARCTSPMEFWSENAMLGPRLLAAWFPGDRR